MNIMDVKAIHELCVCFTGRDMIERFVELPCLAACQALYDKNIQTASSSGNLEVAKHNYPAEIVLVYDSLSDENKAIAEKLRAQGLLEGQKGLSGRADDDCALISPMHEGITVEEVSSVFMKAVDSFAMQDLKYGFRTRQEYYNLIESSCGYAFTSHEDFLETVNAYGQYYDPEEDKVWESLELYEKHKRFQKIDKAR